MRKLVLLVLIISLASLPVAAQTDCRNGLPCGGVPWRIPAVPALQSPTPFPTVIATQASGLVPTSTGTVTATATTTPVFDVGQIDDAFATMSIAIAATVPSVESQTGAVDLGNATGQLIGYARGIQGVHFGIFTPFVSFLFFAFFTFFGTKIISFLMPVISVLVGVLRKIIQTILDFIPG